MLSWLRPISRREQVREDRLLEERVRSFLNNYLVSDATGKIDYYEVVAGAAAACQPSVVQPDQENIHLVQIAAETAFNVFQSRVQRPMNTDLVQSMITDAYATVALAHRRASAAYMKDLEMQRLGTAAVHLVTISTSYMALTNPQA